MVNKHGEYNPSWPIVKHFDQTVYFVRKIKSTKNFDKLINYEAYKLCCGRKHLERIGADYDVVTSVKNIKIFLIILIDYYKSTTKELIALTHKVEITFTCIACS